MFFGLFKTFLSYLSHVNIDILYRKEKHTFFTILLGNTKVHVQVLSLVKFLGKNKSTQFIYINKLIKPQGVQSEKYTNKRVLHHQMRCSPSNPSVGPSTQEKKPNPFTICSIPAPQHKGKETLIPGC